MKVLSFDTGSASLSLALLEAQDELQVLRSQELEPVPPPPGTRGGSRQEGVSRLMPAIDELLKVADCPKEELDLLVVGIGPASFTGIRIGVVTARSIAQALSLPLIGINRFQVIEQHLDNTNVPGISENSEGSIGARGLILDGGRGNLFVGLERGQSAAHYKMEDFVEKVRAEKALLQLNWFVEPSLLSLPLLSELNPKSIPEISALAVLQAEIAYKQIISCNLGLDKFAFEGVNPLYLRGASITMKKNANKASTN